MKQKNLLFGIGVNDADYVKQKFEALGYVDGKQKQKRVWICPYYQTWKHMLERCYSARYQELYPLTKAAPYPKNGSPLVISRHGWKSKILKVCKLTKTYLS